LKTFGLSNDPATNRKLWLCSIAGELGIPLDKFDKSRWNDCTAVQDEQKSYAQHIKHATFVMRVQALELVDNDKHDVSFPVVISDLLKFLKTAAEMTKACEGFPVDERSEWWEAICFLWDGVFCEETVKKGLKERYSEALWHESIKFIGANKNLWLGED
jgi:hypothetical protein